MSSLQEQAAELPATSGVYQFKDARGTILYVGKARNLRARVRQYLAGHDGRPMVPLLVDQARQIDVVLTATEKEALLLEASLIAQHQPRYNTQLRDHTHFMHLRLDVGHDWPRYTLARRPRRDGAKYFGPYTTTRDARNTLEFLQRVFPLRTCTDQVLASRRRPCLLQQMGRCLAPCVDGYTTPEAYEAVVQDSRMFLEGKNDELIERVRERMFAAAEREDFEAAARYRDMVQAVEGVGERQSIHDPNLADRDVWSLWREGERGAAAVLPVREGVMKQPTFFAFDGEVGEDGELLSSWINAWYGELEAPPAEILVGAELPDRAALEEVLGERRGGRVRLHRPQRGAKVRVLEMATENARLTYHRAVDADERRQTALRRLAELCGLEAPPRRLECFDNSTLQGQSPVASQVVFLDGEPSKKHYRTYVLKTVDNPDDYASMAEVLGRRFRRAAEEGVFPNLLVVDGGKGQLNVALKVLDELGFADQPVIGLAKPRVERRRRQLDAVDKIFLPGQRDPIRLPDHDPALNMLRHIRDESHRAAISFHRRRRRSETLRSSLDAIPGVGPGRRKALLRHFGSVKAIREADVAAIAAVRGVGPALAEVIYAHLGGAPDAAAPPAGGGPGAG